MIHRPLFPALFLTCLLVAPTLGQSAGPDSVPAELPGWSEWDWQLSVVQPGNATPRLDLGYLGLWRSTFSEQAVITDEEAAGGFGFGEDSTVPGPDDVGPRLRTAGWVSVAQQYYALPEYDDATARDAAEPVAFVWNHRLQPSTEIYSANRYALAPTSTPRDYVPVSIHEQEDGGADGQESSSLLTILVGIVATLLLGVIVFMPK